MPHFLEQSGVRVFRKDFGVRIVRGTKQSEVRILVPKPVAEACLRLSIQTAEQLMSVLYSGYSSIAQELQWTMPQVLAARQALTEKLHGILDEHYLRPPEPEQVSYGAFGPKSDQSEYVGRK